MTTSRKQTGDNNNTNEPILAMFCKSGQRLWINGRSCNTAHKNHKPIQAPADSGNLTHHEKPPVSTIRFRTDPSDNYTAESDSDYSTQSYLLAHRTANLLNSLGCIVMHLFDTLHSNFEAPT